MLRLLPETLLLSHAWQVYDPSVPSSVITWLLFDDESIEPFLALSVVPYLLDPPPPFAQMLDLWGVSDEGRKSAAVRLQGLADGVERDLELHESKSGFDLTYWLGQD
jgi:hypothetical protein